MASARTETEYEVCVFFTGVITQADSPFCWLAIGVVVGERGNNPSRQPVLL